MKLGDHLKLGALCLLLSGGVIASGATHAKYPDKPITMYIAFAAGGTTDITGRALAQGIEKILGVPVAIENKGGGGATVANGLLASKKPDGYTLLVTSVGSITMRPLLVKLATVLKLRLPTALKSLLQQLCGALTRSLLRRSLTMLCAVLVSRVFHKLRL